VTGLFFYLWLMMAASRLFIVGAGLSPPANKTKRHELKPGQKLSVTDYSVYTL
jgi:hypothetical protein